MNFKEELECKVRSTEDIIYKQLPSLEGYQKVVLDAMDYSVKVGGKRLRPILMKEFFSIFGGNTSVIEPFMAAIEMIHTYSLVHDDLPAMDNDEYRRGKKTTHVVFGEASAILAGDGLLNYAFETALTAFELVPHENDVNSLEQYIRIKKALQILAKKAGVFGMIGGQTADMQAETKGDQVTIEELLFIHKNKTAALIEASMMIGAVLAGATKEQLETVEKIGYDVGIAFQIRDDILDVTSTLEVLGKPIGSDERNNKITYVTLKGLEESSQEVQKISEEAIQLVETLPGNHEFLDQLIRDLVFREK